MTKIPRVCDTPNLEAECLDCTVPEAELMNFHSMGISVICECPIMSELSKPWAELALIYMQGRLND